MIALISMPFASVTHPNLALGQMKAQLTAADLPCKVYNLNFHFARRIGIAAYEVVGMFKGVETQVSEWLFNQHAWGGPVGPPTDQFLETCGEELQNIPHVRDKKAWLRLVKEQVVGQFLQDCLNLLEADGPPTVVGFSCTFFQTLASLALGRLIKERHPHIRLVYGGACFHGEMGEELMRKVPFIDAVSLGEADDVAVPLFQNLSQGRDPENLQGILYRDNSGMVHSGPPHQPISATVLDQIPVPDFDDYFRDAAAVGLSADTSFNQIHYLPFESSRGCWWGQKHHCTFCGLNAEGMDYRAKSAPAVLRILDHFTKRYPGRRFRATDNILARPYFKTLLPKLAQKPYGDDLELFYEVKVNMTREQIKLMGEAGIRYVQPGIESLSDHLIQLMGKGMTALQNVFFMKCCRDYGIHLLWNNLIRIPGERREDYNHMARWMKHLFHLWPPLGGSPMVELHRFSPYYNQGNRWVHKREPAAWYRGLFPEDRIDLNKVAYYFEAQWKDVLPDDAFSEIRAITADWMQAWRNPEQIPQLTRHDHADGAMSLHDTRNSGKRHELDARQAKVYRTMDAPVSFGKLQTLTKEDPVTLKAVTAHLEAANLCLFDGHRYLALATRADAPVPDYHVRRKQLGIRPANQKPKRTGVTA